MMLLLGVFACKAGQVAQVVAMGAVATVHVAATAAQIAESERVRRELDARESASVLANTDVVVVTEARCLELKPQPGSDSDPQLRLRTVLCGGHVLEQNPYTGR
jgi:hypothetical protein